MKVDTLFVILTVASLSLSACGAAAAPVDAPASGYGNSSSATSAPVAAPPTSIPATDAPASAPTEAVVRISGFAFSPSTLEIKVGTTVTWTNADNISHTVEADDGSFASDTLDQGGSFSFTFDKAGSYSYHCGIHSRMKATITVTP